MIIHIRRGWRGSPKPQPTQWPVPRGERSPSARPKHGQGGAVQMLLFRPHRGFFTQALRLFGKSETAGENTPPSIMSLLGRLARAHRGGKAPPGKTTTCPQVLQEGGRWGPSPCMTWPPGQLRAELSFAPAVLKMSLHSAEIWAHSPSLASPPGPHEDWFITGSPNRKGEHGRAPYPMLLEEDGSTFCSMLHGGAPQSTKFLQGPAPLRHTLSSDNEAPCCF